MSTDGVTIESRREDGQYRLRLRFEDQTIIPLTTRTARDWAHEVLRAGVSAEYDAALVTQLTTVAKVSRDSAVSIVMDLRERRAVYAPTLTELMLIPGVSAFDGKPFLRLHLHGRSVGQWTTADARVHALGVLESVDAAEFDGLYYAILIEKAGLDDHRAGFLVMDVGKHRAPPS